MPWTSDLFRHAPAEVLEWIESVGWKREWGYYRGFGGSEAVEVYESHYMDRLWGTNTSSLLTLARDETFAVVGGWPFPLDGEAAPAGELVLTAFACSEPQVEVWRKPSGEYDLVTRLT